MPAGDPDSEEDTQEFPVFTGPYPRPTPTAQPGEVPPLGRELTPPPRAGWPSQPPAHGQGVRPGGVSAAPAQRPSAAYRTSALAATAGIVLLLVGLILTLVGGAGVAMDDLLDEAVRIARDTDLDLKGRALRSLLSAASWIVLVVGVLHLLSAVAVFAHRTWGRFIGLALALPGTLLGAYGVAQSLALSQAGAGVGAAPVAAAVIAVGYGLVLFGLVAGGSHFRRTDANSDNKWEGRPAR